MAVSKAQQKAVAKYVKAKYDRFGLTMSKGRLDEIKSHAEARGESVNGSPICRAGGGDTSATVCQLFGNVLDGCFIELSKVFAE